MEELSSGQGGHNKVSRADVKEGRDPEVVYFSCKTERDFFSTVSLVPRESCIAI